METLIPEEEKIKEEGDRIFQNMQVFAGKIKSLNENYNSYWSQTKAELEEDERQIMSDINNEIIKRLSTSLAKNEIASINNLIMEKTSNPNMLSKKEYGEEIIKLLGSF